MATLPEKTTRNLNCDLTEEEVSTYSNELARITTEQEGLEDEKKSVMSGYKDKIDRCVLDMRTLARKIQTRKEMRDVECRWTFDFSKARATLKRIDTLEIIEERAMTAEELQIELPTGKKKGGAK